MLAEKNEINNSKRRNKGSVISISLVALLIIGIIFCSFILSDNQFVITKSIITLLCLLVVLVLSNSFEHIHFGKWFELSNQIKEGNEKITQLKESSEALFTKILNMNFQNMQAGTINYYLKETDPIKQQQEQEEEQRINESDSSNKRLDIKAFQTLILDKYFGTGLKDKLQKNMSLVESSQNLDQISNREVSFNALLEDNNQLLFIDVMKGQTYGFYYDRIYVKLNKILCYKRATKKEAQFLLLIPKEMNAEKEYRDSFFVKNYAPAIQNNLLRIEYVDYNKDEFESCLVENKRNGKKGD